MYYKNGIKMLDQGKVGCLILAGGKNIRFSDTKNKGMCDIGLLSGKSIF